MFYSEDIIEQVRTENDIVEVIGDYVKLQKKGSSYFGLCPFHNEKSPSFSVSPDKQIFHCFGCGAGGNVIHFISKIENADFKEAIGILANRAGIELPTLNNYEDNKTALLKSKVYEINQIAAEFYHQNLYKPTSKIGQEYIKKRKLDNRTLKSFLIGYSGNFDELYRILKQKGFTEEEILASSLVNKKDDGKYIDRFRKRVMFPIQDTRNKVIAFGGRVTDDSKPKYINSPENIVYSKGRHLFGLNVAKRGELKNIIIVEGYMDAISLYQRGITNVVASLGTALTEAQGRLLRRYSERVTIGYDSDGAGQAATLRGLEILQNIGCDVRILQISGAKDPDEYVIKYGPERFLKCVEQAISLVEFKVKMLKQSLNLDNINDKIKFLNQVAKILSNVTNSIERELYVEKIANEYNVSKEAIYGEVNKLIYTKNTGEKTLEKPIVKKEIKKEKQEIDSSTTKRENLIIYLLINYPQESYKKIKSVISENDMKLEENQKILKKMYEEIEKGNINIDILNYFEEQNIIDHISGIMSYDFEISDLNKCIEDVVNTYEKDKLINRRQEILDIIKNGQGFSEEELNNLEDELSNIVIKLKK